MARAPDPRVEQAKAMYLDGQRLSCIASRLQVSESTLRRWKRSGKWEDAPKAKTGELGFLSRYLPEETASIIRDMPGDPLDILWDQVRLAYAAIIRAQQIMFVREEDGGGEEDKAKESIRRKQDWERQAGFLQAQSRAQKTLEELIRQYDGLLNRRWDLATEEQKARIAALKAKTRNEDERPIHITFTKAGEGGGGHG